MFSSTLVLLEQSCDCVRTDSIFYEIFQNEPTIICELLGHSDPRMSAYGFGSQEVKETSFRLDGILLPGINLSRERHCV